MWVAGPHAELVTKEPNIGAGAGVSGSGGDMTSLGQFF